MKELEIKSGFKLPDNIPIEIKNFKQYLGVTYEEYNNNDKIYVKKDRCIDAINRITR